MKKNLLSDKNYGKGSKGFYAALGISAVMIGSACFFAYNQGEKLSNEKLSAENNISASDAAVDNQITDIPKSTTPPQRVTTVTVTTPIEVTVTAAYVPEATLPAADIVQSEPPENIADAAAVDDEFSAEPAAEIPEDYVQTGVQKLENVKAPLADMSNVLNPFSGTELVKNETTGSWQTHNGTDLAAEVGTDVYAVSSGEIVSISNDPIWGVTVILDHHNGFMTKYCGLGSDLSVQQGDVVVSGDVIGTVGGTADIESTLSPHLHIEITHNGSYIDPISAVNS